MILNHLRYSRSFMKVSLQKITRVVLSFEFQYEEIRNDSLFQRRNSPHIKNILVAKTGAFLDSQKEF